MNLSQNQENKTSIKYINLKLMHFSIVRQFTSRLINI